MMSLLKRFEEEAAVDEDGLREEALGKGGSEGGEEGKEDLLIERFSGIDIGERRRGVSSERFEMNILDTLSSEEMWDMLTPAEKEEFLKALENPTSQVAQRLLASEQLELELEKPWWSDDDTGQVRPELGTKEGDGEQAKLRPEAIRIPQSMVKPVPHGHPLVYNLCAIWYAQTWRCSKPSH